MLSAICDELAVFCQFSEKASAKSAIGHEIERRELKTWIIIYLIVPYSYIYHLTHLVIVYDEPTVCEMITCA